MYKRQAADRDLSQKLTFDLTQSGTNNIAETQLNDSSFTNSETTVTVDSTAGFATSGTIRIEDEYITYTGKTGTTFTGATRGAITGFSAATHDNDDIVTAAGENLNRLTFDSSSTTALSKVLFTLRGNAANDIFDGFIAGNEVLVFDDDSDKFFEGVITDKTSADEVVIRPMMYLALSYDHRLVDGRDAVGFLVKVKETLEDPARLLLNI